MKTSLLVLIVFVCELYFLGNCCDDDKKLRIYFDKGCELGSNWHLHEPVNHELFSVADKWQQGDIVWVGTNSVKGLRECMWKGENCSLRTNQSVSMIPEDRYLGLKYLFTDTLYEDPVMKETEVFYPITFSIYDEQGPYVGYEKERGRESFLRLIEQTYGLESLSKTCCKDCIEVELNRTCPVDIDHWVLKPGGRALGEGIILIDPNHIDDFYFEVHDEITRHTMLNGLKYLSQRYIPDPYLYQGKYKCSLRKYFLVASMNPFLVLAYPEILFICGGVEYSLKGGFENNDIVVTNYHVHKKYGAVSPGIGMDEYEEDIRNNPAFSNETKLNFREKFDLKTNAITAYLSSRFRDKVMEDTLLTKMFETGLDSTSEGTRKFPHYFELFALDLTLDSNLKIWLTEVQALPSLELTEYEYKWRIKKPLITEVFQIVKEVRKKLMIDDDVVDDDNVEDENIKFLESVKRFEWIIQGDEVFFHL